MVFPCAELCHGRSIRKLLVKGAIDQVAARMGVSKVTVYSYLDEAKGKK